MNAVQQLSNRRSDASSRSDALLVRNYDLERCYRLRLQATHLGSEHEYETRYCLQPGQVVAESGALVAGTYDVTVELGGTGRQQCTVDVTDHSDGTVLVEVGNGIVTVSQGVYESG